MEAVGTAMFDTLLSECCVYSPSFSDSSSQSETSGRLLVKGSVVAAGMLILYESRSPR